MDRVIGRWWPHTYAAFRIMIGLLFFFHGSQKILGWPPMQGAPPGGLPPIAIAAGVIELTCGFLVTIGLFTGLAAFIASGEMAVAFFTGHFRPTGMMWHPLVNHGEDAVLYCFAFLYMAAHGAGIWSVDNAVRRKGGVSGSAVAAQP